MGPKKKGKQNKLTKLSDEDRLRYLQHKAAQEEEARRRKQQLVANFVKVEFILATIYLYSYFICGLWIIFL
jgi:hypothetical protein